MRGDGKRGAEGHSPAEGNSPPKWLLLSFPQLSALCPHQVDLFIDMHAHSTSRRSFMFCNKAPPAAAPPPVWTPMGLAPDPMERVSRLPK